MNESTAPPDANQLIDWVVESRRRTLDLVADLSEEQLIGPELDIVNPPLWELGHVAWFQEFWVLRHALGGQGVRPDVDRMYNSAGIAHFDRWTAPVLNRHNTLAYLIEVRDAVHDALSRNPLDDALRYFVTLSVFHEDMHAEAFTYTRQTHGYPPPTWSGVGAPRGEGSTAINRDHDASTAASSQDIAIPGGTFLLGATDDEWFTFDNEHAAHPVTVRPFSIDRCAVTQGQYAEFVEDDGYRRDDLWTVEGLAWRNREQAVAPVYWRKEPSGWHRRDFQRWALLEPRLPMLHVNWYEALAYCTWRGRRLPSEAEWEFAAVAELGAPKRRFPWGERYTAAGPPDDPHHHVREAHLDWAAMGAIDVAALPQGDSPWGCRQMIGNVWEWTADGFLPYPGFQSGSYKEYSIPWFGDHKVLRGGSWCTRSRWIRGAVRSFYLPHRRDVWAGFRTCEIDEPSC